MRTLRPSLMLVAALLLASHAIAERSLEGVTVPDTQTVNGTPTGTIEGAEFRRALMSVWLGKKPPNKGLKEGILGR